VGGTTFDDISGATNSSYNVHPADIGRAIRAVVTLRGFQGTINSNQTIAIPNPVPNINATPQVHQTLSITSDLNLAGASFQWRRHSTLGGATFDNISGATSSTYTVRPIDVGRSIEVNVILQGIPIISNRTSLVLPVISGTPWVGQTLTAVVDVPDASFQWQRNSININGATGSSYNVQQADIGYTIRVVVTFGLIPVISNPTVAVLP
jgi:hypothetical protein